MQELKFIIPTYKEINDFFASIPSEDVTNNPLFFCFRLKKWQNSGVTYKPPFKKDFYFISLITNAGNTKITYDNPYVGELNSFLVFQSPGLLYSFSRDDSANGYLIYFKKELFNFFKPEFDAEFPFFDMLHTNFFNLNPAKFKELVPHFEEVFTAYESAKDNQHTIATIKILALLYQLKELTAEFNLKELVVALPQQILLQKFIQLVNNFYLEKKTIEEYADLLSVTPNHLSQAVKMISGKNALSFINDRIISEAKSIIQFTNFDIAEIAYQLNFSDSSNFGKFFKKHTDVTPVEFRRNASHK
jgi:AraC family transcriptional regulator, transcriptional activator of pobA